MSRHTVSRRAQRSVDRFSLKLREALGKFADGVHEINAPHDGPLDAPESMRRVYAFSDGIDLFGDVVRVVPAARLVRDGDRLRIGEAEGRTLWCEPGGAIVDEDEDGDRLHVADDLEAALLVYLARESLLVGNDGEWKEVFGDDGEIVPAVRRKRCEAARKRAPSASRWLVEAAELALELDGDDPAAIALCAEACEHDPGAAGPAELEGLLRASSGDVRGGAAALVRAAERSGPSRRADRAATAAEASARIGDEGGRAKMAALAIATEPAIAARLAGEAEAAIDGGRMDDADRLAAIVAAVAGEGALGPRARGRRRLRVG